MDMVGVLDDDELIEEESFHDDCCPNCGSYLIHRGRCLVCMVCGYSDDDNNY